MDSFKNDNSEEMDLLELAANGDSQSLQEIFTRYSERLKRMIRLRIDPRVKGRVDASDVIQEAYIEICRKLPDYVREPKMPFFLWLRLMTGQKLAQAHRHHLGVQGRNAGREVSLFAGAMPEVSSAVLAAQLMGRLTTPSQAAMKAELKVRIQEALNSMEPIDREILTLRHFEQLTNSDTAMLLGIKENTACNRYIRALERLKQILQAMPGAEGEW